MGAKRRELVNKATRKEEVDAFENCEDPAYQKGLPLQVIGYPADEYKVHSHEGQLVSLQPGHIDGQPTQGWTISYHVDSSEG